MIFLSGLYEGKEENKKLAIESAKYIKEHYDIGKVIVSGIFSIAGEYEDISMRDCIQLLDKCDSVVFLDNFEDSSGAKEEYEHVRFRKWVDKYLFDTNNKSLYRMNKNELILVKPIDKSK